MEVMQKSMAIMQKAAQDSNTAVQALLGTFRIIEQILIKLEKRARTSKASVRGWRRWRKRRVSPDSLRSVAYRLPFSNLTVTRKLVFRQG